MRCVEDIGLFTEKCSTLVHCVLLHDLRAGSPIFNPERAVCVRVASAADQIDDLVATVALTVELRNAVVAIICAMSVPLLYI